MAKQAVQSEEIQKSREVAEAARETEWQGAGFLRELFLGRFRLDLIDPYPLVETNRAEFRRFYEALCDFLKNEVDSSGIDARGEYPDEVLNGLRRLGAFGMKVPVEYGGLGLSQVEYGKVMQLLGSVDGNLNALLSAHQSIGVPQPLKVFGSEELKKKYLPRIAKGAISGFALTEADVGSDPARLTTSAELTEDGSAYILNGSKLWCTNGTIAEVLVVMARNPKTEAISAFVVETNWPGVEIMHRCRFMGLRALGNASLRFTNVRVPRENLIGKEGRGLKIALTTLNTGRLALPATVVGAVKVSLELCRKWSNARAQWGQEIGKHEAIAHKLADMGSTCYAMESVSDLSQTLADKKGYDIRLEAAAAKEWTTVKAWHLLDDTMQIRGGRGYETAHSLASRGEAGVPVERWLRDARINLIFEGSSEIMHLFMAREAVDKHLQVAGSMIDPKVPWKKKLSALPKIAMFYFVWYLGLWFRGLVMPRFSRFGKLAPHLRFVERRSRKLAREIFHSMVVFRAAAERKQAFLFRLVDIANELFAMAASISRAQTLARTGRGEAEHAAALAENFCAQARERVDQLFYALWHNHDDLAYRTGRAILAGEHAWLERGVPGLGLTIDDLRPKLPPAPPAESPRPGLASRSMSA